MGSLSCGNNPDMGIDDTECIRERNIDPCPSFDYNFKSRYL